MPRSEAYERARRADRRAEQARAEAEVLWSRVYVPGVDDEPPLSAVLYDRLGAPWVTGGKTGSGWRPADVDKDFGLKWSSPAMAHAGPFVGPRKRDPEVLADMRRRAADIRWHGDADTTGRGPLRDPKTKTGRRALMAAALDSNPART